MILDYQECIDTIWYVYFIYLLLIRLAVSLVMILTMKLGFALLEVGSVRIKNSSNILMKNVVDTLAGALIYYLIGYGLQMEQ